ncbi:MAG: hypothetical protein JNG84_00120, partial [Archangium sp.]|nr:hypothetical protein [Archangium sp.]
DSQHVSAALWAGRVAFAGTDNGATYDQAFYAMLVSISPSADFAATAAAMTARVKQAFPANTGAEAQMNAIFQAKGVTGCSKVLEVTSTTPARPYFAVPVISALGNSLLPGPFQFKLSVPSGARRVTVQGQLAAGSPLGGAAATLTALVKASSPITFTRSGNTLTNDSTESKELTGMGTATAAIDVAIPCGSTSEVYVALAAPARSGATAQSVSVTVEPLQNCMLPVDAGTPMPMDGGSTLDAGVPDAGPSVDTKTVPSLGAGNVTSGKPAATGCGCTSVDLAPVLAAAALLFLRRRR